MKKEDKCQWIKPKKKTQSEKKRIELKKWQKILLAMVALFVCFTLWMIWGNISLQVTNYTITSSRLPDSFDGFKIVQISDLHDAEFGEDNIRLANKVRKIAPDIIVLTGDFVDSFRPDVDQSVSFASQAVQIAPTYYVPGNHEARLNDPSLYEKLTEAGVTVLFNKSVPLVRGNEQIQLIGLMDISFKEAKDTVKALSALMPKDDSYTVLLSHRPEPFEKYVQCKPDLVLCGHVHGGQARLPFIGGIYGSNQGFFPEYDAGVYTSGRTNMIISRGLGNSRFPIRFNNRPEIVVVTLEKG